MKPRKVVVKIKHQHGVKTIVPVNELAILFARIAGTHNTLTKPAIDAIKELGYSFETEQEKEMV